FGCGGVDHGRRHWVSGFGDRHSPLSRRLVGRRKVNRGGIDAVAQPRRRRSVVKDVSQMPATLRAEDLGASTKERTVNPFDDGARFAGVEARPPAAGVEFLCGAEELLSAAATRKDPV